MGFYRFNHFHHTSSLCNFSYIMYRRGLLLHSRLKVPASSWHSSTVRSFCSGKISSSREPNGSCDRNKPTIKTSQRGRSIRSMEFWTHKPAWKRAGLNTLRCLVGCTTGDFSALWMLQSYYPGLGMGTIMMASSKFVPFIPGLLQRLYKCAAK